MNWANYRNALHNEIKSDELELVVECFRRRCENILQIMHLASEINKRLCPSQLEESRILMYNVCHSENFRKSQEDALLKQYADFLVIDVQMRKYF